MRFVFLAFFILCMVGCKPGYKAHETTYREIFKKKSVYRNIIVSDGTNRRCMTFGKIYGYQSCVDPSDNNNIIFNYYRGLIAITAFVERPSRILVLGVGGGVIPTEYARIYPGVEIDAVELDPAVIDVAKEFFNYRDDGGINTHVGDARVFVRQQLREGRQYDIIVLDAFDKEFIPEHLLTVEFFNQIHGILSPYGIVAANTFTHGRQVEHEDATYQAIFPSVFEVPLGENRIVVAAKELTQFANEKRGAHTERLGRYRFDANDILSRFVPVKVATVKPFTDKYAPINLL